MAIPRTEGDTVSPSPANDGGMDLPVEWVTGTVTAPYGHPMTLVAYSVSGDIRLSLLIQFSSSTSGLSPHARLSLYVVRF